MSRRHLGRAPTRRPRALVQLASTLRNLGRPHEAIELLESGLAGRVRPAARRPAATTPRPPSSPRPFSTVTWGSRRAVAQALDVLAPHLRAIRRYAGELVDVTPQPQHVDHLGERPTLPLVPGAGRRAPERAVAGGAVQSSPRATATRPPGVSAQTFMGVSSARSRESVARWALLCRTTPGGRARRAVDRRALAD
ncbi:tetratricopeptide repeat protein [Geodermatophilus sp. DF01-2]|nr:tetratricopeptide repeat protein [Geodermatophilus sp. DF01_2]